MTKRIRRQQNDEPVAEQQSDSVESARTHKLFPAFIVWGEANGVHTTDDPCDWMPWWDCFMAGARALATTAKGLLLPPTAANKRQRTRDIITGSSE